MATKTMNRSAIEDKHDDSENIDLKNYKGIYANEDNSQKYQCPVTGAHFEVKDLCRRLTKIQEARKPQEEALYGALTQSTQQPNAEVFTSSMVSEKLGQMHQQQMVGNQKNIQFKNKFEEPAPIYDLKPRVLAPSQPTRGLTAGNTRNNKENFAHSYANQAPATSYVLQPTHQSRHS